MNSLTETYSSSKEFSRKHSRINQFVSFSSSPSGALNELNNPSIIQDTDAPNDETQRSALDKSEELNQLTDTFKKLSECTFTCPLANDFECNLSLPDPHDHECN